MEINRLEKSGVSFIVEGAGFGALELTFQDTDNQKKANKWLKMFLQQIQKKDYDIDLT